MYSAYGYVHMNAGASGGLKVMAALELEVLGRPKWS